MECEQAIKSAICDKMGLSPTGLSSLLHDMDPLPEVEGFDESLADRLNADGVNPSALGRPYVAFSTDLNNTGSWSHRELLFYGVTFPGADRIWPYVFAVKRDNDDDVGFEQLHFEAQCHVGGQVCRLHLIEIDWANVEAERQNCPGGCVETALVDFNRRIVEHVDWTLGDQRVFSLILKVSEEVREVDQGYQLALHEMMDFRFDEVGPLLQTSAGAQTPSVTIALIKEEFTRKY
eukprot:46390-Amphidinium_carterae.1